MTASVAMLRIATAAREAALDARRHDFARMLAGAGCTQLQNEPAS